MSMEVETCGECWMVQESVLIFICTPVISTSLASKPRTANNPILPAIIILPSTVALSVVYLLLFCLTGPGWGPGRGKRKNKPYLGLVSELRRGMGPQRPVRNTNHKIRGHSNLVHNYLLLRCE